MQHTRKDGTMRNSSQYVERPGSQFQEKGDNELRPNVHVKTEEGFARQEEGAERPKQVRRMRLTKELFEDPNGPRKTPNCPGCIAITRGRKAVAHWESCSERVDAWLAVNSPDRYWQELEKYAESNAEEKRQRDEQITKEAKRQRAGAEERVEEEEVEEERKRPAKLKRAAEEDEGEKPGKRQGEISG